MVRFARAVEYLSAAGAKLMYFGDKQEGEMATHWNHHPWQDLIH